MIFTHCDKAILIQALELWELNHQNTDSSKEVRDWTHNSYVDLLRKVQKIEPYKTIITR